MATYYVSTARGSDANTTVQAQSASTPWKTVGKALGTSAGVAGAVVAGDTVNVEPGVYRELVKLSASGSLGSIIAVQGDVDGSAFRAGGYATPATGEVQLTAYTTNDRTQPGTTATLQLNGKPYYTFARLSIIGGRGTNQCVDGGVTAGSRGITLRDCYLLAPTNVGMQILATADTALDLTVDRCIFAGYWDNLQVSAPASATAEYNLNVSVQNCLFINGQAWAVRTICSNTAASNKMAYGVTVQGCTVLADRGIGAYIANTGITVVNASITVKNSFVWAFRTLYAGSAGMLTEDYNIYYSDQSLNLITPGTHSSGNPTGGSQNVSPLFHWGQEWIWGGMPRPAGMPMAGSPFLNFGDGSGTSYDLAGRNRPEGS